MQFNPYQARATLVDPSASQGGINNLLQMQQKTLGDLVDTFGNIGKTSRTNTVNDLIARGGLEGLNEAQTQARIQQEAGGTLTPEGQAQVNQLLQTAGQQDQRQFTTAERLGGEEYRTNERVAGDKTAEGVAELLNKNSITKDKVKALADLNEFNKQLDETKRQHTDATNSVETDALGRLWKINKVTGLKQLLVGAQKPLNEDGSSDKSGKDDGRNLTGDVKKLYDISELGAKDAIDQFYKSNKFNVKRIPVKGEDGLTRETYQPQWYGQPIHTSEMTRFIETGYLPSRFKGVVPQKIGAKFLEPIKK